MKNKLKVVLICGLTNGKIVYDYLSKNKYIDIALTITYRNNISKPRSIPFPDGEKIIKSDTANNYIDLIRNIKPTFIFVAGWSELLSEELIKIPTKGTIGFHPSKLPLDKGRSVLAWQIEDGYAETALTMFYYNEYPDGGDIIAQEKIVISVNDSINDILNKVDFATSNLMRAYFPLIRQGMAPRIKQNLNQGNFRRLRTELDSYINWNNDSVDIYNKVRAISKPYPGAIAIIEGEKHIVWKSKVIKFNFGNEMTPGTKIAILYNNNFVIKSRDGFILITEYEKIK